MAYFEPAVLTSAGANLIAKDIAGISDIEFVKMVSGAGEYTEEQKTRNELASMEALKDQRQEFVFSGIEVTSEQSVLLKSVISNENLEDGYRITEIGVYAREKGADGDGVLYSVALAIEADYLPPYNGLNPSEIIQEYYATVSDAATVNIVSAPGAYALHEDLEELKERVRIAEGSIGDLDNLQTGEKGNIVGAVNELEERTVETVDPMTATEEGFAADAKLTGEALRDLSANLPTFILDGTTLTITLPTQDSGEVG